MSKMKSIREIEMERAAAPNFGKGITVASGFDLGAKAPLDSRMTVKTVEERDAHVAGNRAYEGMLVYVEADKKTYQLVNNTWEEFGFNEEKFEAGIKPVKDRLETLEELVVGGEGEGIEAIIGDVAQAKEDIAGLQTNLETKASKEELTSSINGVNSKIDSVESSVETLEGNVNTNTQNITKLNSDLQAEVTRAKGEEAAIRKELTDAIAEVESNHSDLAGKVSTNEKNIAKNASDIAKEVADRTSAISSLNAKVSELDAAYKNADTAINGRLDALESNTADLEQIRTDIESNTSAINREVADRQAAVKSVDDKLTAEVSRATAAEVALGKRIDGVESTLASEIQETKELVDTKAAETLQSAKSYTDGKVTEINANHSKLAERVTTNEGQLATVDSRIATAKTQAVNDAKAHTNAEIAKIDTAYKAADAQVLSDAKAHAESKIAEAKTTLEASINAVDTKANGINTKVVAVEGNVTALTQRVSTNESDIANLKDAVSNKNNNTIVVNTEDEIASENTNPKVGDIAFVVSSKRAYIYKGVAALAVENAPAGWVVFDEITSELDLVDYMKTADANATFRKLSDKIAEGDLATELSTKINNKADKSYVDGELAKKTNEAYVNNKVESVVNPVRTQVTTNTGAIADLTRNLNDEVSRLEELNSKSVSSLNRSIQAVDSKADTLSTSLTEKEAALKAEDTKLNNRINKFVPVVSEVQPEGTETGHVWLELV